MGGGLAVSWSDSGARTGPHEIGLIAKIAAKSDDDAARRLYRKYRMELFRFGFHVLHDQGLAEEMVQETFIKFCQQARNYDASRGPVRGWLFTMARSAAYDIARRPSSRPFLPVEDFQLPPQYDTVDEALTVLTVDQALDKLPSIYADVMRLVRDGFTHSEIAERLDIPIGTVKSRIGQGSRHVAGRAGQPARERRCCLSGTSSRPIPRPSTSHSATCPRPSVPSFNRHLTGCRYCQGIVDEYSEIGGIIKNLPPHVEPPADLEDRTVAAMVAALAEQRAEPDRPVRRRGPEPPPGSTRSPSAQPPAEPETQVQPRSANSGLRPGAASPTGGHPPAGVATLPRPPGRCRCRRRCRHHCRHRHPAQPSRRRGPPRSSSRLLPPRRPR